MMKTTVLNPFTINPEEHASIHAIHFPEDSLTVQADAQAADINFIVKQFGVTGRLPYGRQVPFYDDISEFPVDYHTAMNVVVTAENSFMELDADVRSHFKNDPSRFLEALDDPNQRATFEKLGLVHPLKQEEAPPPGGDEAPVEQA